MNRARRAWKTCFVIFLLAVSLIGCATSEEIAKPAVVPAVVPAQGASPKLTKMKVDVDGGLNKVVLQGNLPITYTAHFDGPQQTLVMDLSAGADPEVLGMTTVNNGTINKIDVDKGADGKNLIRIKIALNKTIPYQVVSEGNNLVVQLGQKDSPAGQTSEQTLTSEQPTAGTARITAVDFKAVDRTGRSRLVIQVDKSIKPQVLTKENGRTVIVSLSPATIAKSLVRPLDTTYFQSAVNYIKPEPAKGKSVDFLVRFREPVPYHLSQNGTDIYVDFENSDVSPLKVEESKFKKKPGSGETLGSQVAVEAGSKMGSQPAGGTKAEGLTGGIFGQPLDGGKKKAYSGQRISLDFQNAEVANIIRLLGEVSGKNVIVSDDVKGKVTLQLKNIPWDEALDNILSMQNLDVLETNNIMRVDTIKKIAEEKEKEKLQEKEVKDRKERVEPIDVRYTVRYADPNALAKKISGYFKLPAPVVITDSDSTEAAKTPAGAAPQPSAPTPGAAQQPGAVTAEQKEKEQLQVLIIQSDIFFRIKPDQKEKVLELCKEYDTPLKQILIESRIVMARETFTRNIGINWGGQAGQKNIQNADGTWSPQISQGNAYTTGLYGATTTNSGMAVNVIDTSTITSGLGIGFGILGDMFSLDARLYASETAGEVRTLSAPRIMAKNDEEVFINRGTKIPYTTIDDKGRPVTQFETAVLELRVKPRMEKNGEILKLDIKVKNDFPDLTAERPLINTREAQTKVYLKNSETLVIGGIISDDENRGQNRVPGLHRIPILGWLFKNDSVNNTKEELLIFLTASVIPVKFDRF